MSANRLKLNADKTEILWVGPKCTLSQLDGCMQFGADTTVASDHVCLLGVTITADLSLDQHVSGISATSFYWLRLLRQVRHSLEAGLAATLVRAFVCNWIDYCNTMLATTPKVITDQLQRVLNAAASVLSDTNKFDTGLTCLLHNESHWLDVPDRDKYKFGVMMFSVCIVSYHFT